MAQNAGHIAQPCRRGRSLRTVCGDSDACAVFELNHMEPAFFPHPCAETSTRAETPTRAETRILTVRQTKTYSGVLRTYAQEPRGTFGLWAMLHRPY